MMRTRRLPYLLLPLLAALLLPGPARAADTTVRLPGSWRTWTLKVDGKETASVSQFHLPVVATAGLGSRADLVLSGSGAFASTEKPSESLNGMTDVTAELFLRTPGNRFLLQAGVGLPTGKTELDGADTTVALRLAQPVLGFRAKDYGAGFNLSAGAAAALPLASGAKAGFGVGLVHRGSYTLFAGGGDYRPAPEVSFSAGLDLEGRSESGPAPLLRLDAVYRIFGKDELDGRTIFEEGNQVELTAGGRSGGEGFRVDGMLRTVLKGDNTVYTGQGATVEALKASSGTWILGRARGTFPLGRALRAGPAGEWNHLSGSNSASLNGDAYGVGAAAGLALGRRGRLDLEALRQFGTLHQPDGPDLDLSGTSIGFTLTWQAS